jgi:hypothetical protein
MSLRTKVDVTWKRKRPVVQVTMSIEVRERLDKMAARCGETRSGMVEKLVREAEMPRAFGKSPL